MLGLFSLPFSSFSNSGWDYMSVTTLDKMEGRMYLVTHCTEFAGDDCTTPNSSFRIDVTEAWELLTTVGRMIKIK